MSHKKIEVISKLKGTIYIPSAELKNILKIAPSKLDPKCHFSIEKDDIFMLELKTKLKDFLKDVRLDSSIFHKMMENTFHKMMEMEAKMLQRYIFLDRKIPNEVSVRYAVVDPIVDCLVTIFNLCY